MARLKDLRVMTVADLDAKEAEVRQRLARLSMQRHARRLDKTSDLKATKKELARVLTVLRNKRSAEAGETSS